MWTCQVDRKTFLLASLPCPVDSEGLRQFSIETENTSQMKYDWIKSPPEYRPLDWAWQSNGEDIIWRKENRLWRIILYNYFTYIFQEKKKTNIFFLVCIYMSHFSSRQQLSPLMRPYSPAFNCVAAFSPIFSLAETSDRRKTPFLNRTLLHHSCNHFHLHVLSSISANQALRARTFFKKKNVLGKCRHINTCTYRQVGK